MARMTDTEREDFLLKTRLGMLSLLREDGSPVTVPVWFEWTGGVVRMFTSVVSAKVKRIANDPRASLLVANDLDEHERWVAFDGEIEIQQEGGLALAERLAPRYWDLGDPERSATLDAWRAAGSALRILALRPTRIRTYHD
ncbi:MAG: pyridoxamine 5'-phosphate oxidase family protein [Myxococcota bacterium]